MTDKAIHAINGVLSRTISSNNLIVALKNFNGTDFSGSVPFVHKIGDTPRTLTGALSVTINAGESTFNLGSNELKTKDTDLFTYIGWRASNSSMFILVSRIPYARVYGDFSATTTNEKYGAYSGAAPAATDPVTVIGRFNVQNSGTASFNWSIPATSIVINDPIYHTRKLAWTPTVTSTGGTPTSVTSVGEYIIDKAMIFVRGAFTIVNKGTATGALLSTAPFTPISNVAISGVEMVAAGYLLTASYQTTPRLSCNKYDLSGMWTDNHVPTVSGWAPLI